MSDVKVTVVKAEEEPKRTGVIEKGKKKLKGITLYDVAVGFGHVLGGIAIGVFGSKLYADHKSAPADFTVAEPVIEDLSTTVDDINTGMNLEF